ncbi:MAG: hypothetical protein K2W78_06475 [Xanthobacteraceae bacterium]|nr:hypothetical protein [Xanthobacteraceae bacterium]
MPFALSEPGATSLPQVIAVFESRLDEEPCYFMWLEWRHGKITHIRDCKYVRYVMADAELTFPT